MPKKHWPVTKFGLCQFQMEFLLVACFFITELELSRSNFVFEVRNDLFSEWSIVKLYNKGAQRNPHYFFPALRLSLKVFCYLSSKYFRIFYISVSLLVVVLYILVTDLPGLGC